MPTKQSNAQHVVGYEKQLVGSFTKPRMCTFLPNPVLAWRQLRQSCAPGHKTLYAIANEKLLFCDVPKARTSISQNYQF